LKSEAKTTCGDAAATVVNDPAASEHHCHVAEAKG
jgi:hypothetical protein